MKSARALPVLACLCAAVAAGGAGRTAAGTADALLAPAGTCGAAADRPRPDATSVRRSILCLTNYARTRAGLVPLRASAVLDRAGADRLRQDVECGQFSHTPCGRPFAEVFAPYLSRARGYRIGENIAWAPAESATPRSTMQAWLASAGHRANILSPAFRDLGVGYLPDTTLQDAPQSSLWSEEFGSRTTATR